MEQRSYGSMLGYQCGLARQFQDPETESEQMKRIIFKPLRSLRGEVDAV